MLLEALVAVLVTSIIAAGLAHVQATLMAGQRATTMERLVVAQLRNQLQASGTALCDVGTIALPLASTLQREATVACGAVPSLQVGVAGALREVDAPRQIDLSVPAAELDPDAGTGVDNATDLLLSSRQ